MLTLLLQDAAAALAGIDMTTVIVAVITLVSGAVLGSRLKNRADAAKSVMDVASSLAKELKASYEDMKTFRQTFAKTEEEKRMLGRQAAAAEDERDDLKRCLGSVKEDAAEIAEHLTHLSFVPTGEPTPDDQSAIRRLKQIRDASRRMTEAIAECEC